MYASQDVYISCAEEAARQRVAADRELYQPFLRRIEQFAAEHKLIVGGAAGMALLHKGAEAPTSYTLYMTHPVRMARELVDILYNIDPTGLGHYACLITRIAGVDLTISINRRDLVNMRALPHQKRLAEVTGGMSKGIALMTVFRPGLYDSTRQLQCFGPEMQLIAIYRTLCAPDSADEWPEMLTMERRLRNLLLGDMHKRIAAYVAKISGGAQQPQQILQQALLKQLVGMAVLVNPQPHAAKLQMVTAVPFDELAETTQRLARDANMTVQIERYDLAVPTDPHLRRMTVYTTLPHGGRAPVVDFYDSASRELVPMRAEKQNGSGGEKQDGSGSGKQNGSGGEKQEEKQNTPRIGTAYVIMRFILVEMWNLQFLAARGAIQVSTAEKRMRSLIQDYKAIGTEVDKMSAAELFPTTSADYMGQFVDENVANKRAAFEQSVQTRVGQKIYPARFDRPTPGE